MKYNLYDEIKLACRTEKMDELKTYLVYQNNLKIDLSIYTHVVLLTSMHGLRQI